MGKAEDELCESGGMRAPIRQTLSNGSKRLQLAGKTERTAPGERLGGRHGRFFFVFEAKM